MRTSVRTFKGKGCTVAKMCCLDINLHNSLVMIFVGKQNEFGGGGGGGGGPATVKQDECVTSYCNTKGQKQVTKQE